MMIVVGGDDDAPGGLAFAQRTTTSIDRCSAVITSASARCRPAGCFLIRPRMRSRAWPALSAWVVVMPQWPLASTFR